LLDWSNYGPHVFEIDNSRMTIKQKNVEIMKILEQIFPAGALIKKCG